ncbi:MAG: hypothetical protein QOH73_1176 [Gaiellaceae bacterium]|jgi:predicted secreted protein|nr:hypothetical protein [Gaiellaceae bacterium]
MGALSRTLSIAVLLAAALVCAVVAGASAPPVGPLPAGPTKTVVVKRGKAFVVNLPKSTVAGRVWRLARTYDRTVVYEVAEGEKGNVVWVRFRAGRIGTTRIVYALTLGEGRHAYKARRYAVRVIP